MITLKTVKAICPVCDVKTQTELFVGKWQIDNFGALFVGNKDWTKAEIRQFSFLRKK